MLPLLQFYVDSFETLQVFMSCSEDKTIRPIFVTFYQVEDILPGVKFKVKR